MLKLRKLATVFLTSLVIFAWSLPVNDVHSLSTTPVSSGLILDGGFDVVPDGAGNFYIFSYDKENKQTAITKFDTSSLTSIEFLNSSNMATPLKTLNHGYAAVYYSNSQPSNSNFGNDSLNLFYVDNETGSNHFVQYRYPTSTVHQKYGWQEISDMNIELGANKPEKQNTAVGSNGDMFIFASGNNFISVYNPDGTQQIPKEASSFPTIAAITTDISRTYLYAATNNTLYRYKISDGTYTFESTAIDGNFAPFKFLTDNIFITSAGKICALNSSEFKLDFNVDMKATMENYPACVAIAGFDNASILAKTAEKVVSRIRCSDGAETGKIEFSEKVLAVATSGEKTIVVTEGATNKNIHLITVGDITEITPPESERPPETGGGTNPDFPNPDTPPETPEDTSIESTEGYEVGENVISKIPAGTSWGTLRNGLEANYVTVELNEKSNATTSTKVATGHKVTFIFDNERKVTKTFTLIVEGDVTGSGNISTKSISALANHLLGKTELEGVYKDAANLSGDGDLSTVDLFLMYKQTQK